MIYVLVLSFASFCSYLMNRTTGSLKWGVAFLAVFAPSLLYGLRSVTIGTDTLVYVVPIWERSQDIHSFDYGPFWNSAIEVGYRLLNYVASVFFHDVHWILFIIATIVCALSLQSIVFFKRNMWIGYLFFLFVFSPLLMNTARQCLALAISMIAFSACLQMKWAKYFLFIFFATLFHKSSVIELLFPLLFVLFQRKNTKICLLVLLSFVLLCTLLGQHWSAFALFFSDKYASYFNNTYKPHFTIFSLLNVPFIIIFSIYYDSLKKMFRFLPFVLFMLVTGFLFSQLSWLVSVFLMRIAEPFNAFLIYASIMLLQWVKSKKNRLLTMATEVGCILYAVLFFIGSFVVAGRGNFYPYCSDVFDEFVSIYF